MGVVETQDLVSNPVVDGLRERLFADYGHDILSGKLIPDPSIRGPYGEAEILVKPGATPVKHRPFQLQGDRRAAWVTATDQLVQDGKIEPGWGPWSSPSFTVPKKDGKHRFVVDFRALNEAIVTDAHPLPLIEDILQRQGGFKIWTVLDMKDGFHQIPLKETHRDLTCMSTPRGTYR